MNNQPRTALSPEGKQAWFGIGAVFLILVLGLLFFVFAGKILRHESRDEAPPAHDVTRPGPVEPH
jgi:hypothetical protein